MRSAALYVLVALAVVAGALWYVVGRRSVFTTRANLILISLDTCRADHLGCYGHEARATPHLDRVAEEGVLFRNVITPVPMTLPAHSSLLTGTIPPYHGVHDNIHYRLGDSNVTLAEHLRQCGYTTAGVIGAYVLDSRTGIDQGFDFFDDAFVSNGSSTQERPERRAAEVTRIAQSWLADRLPMPFFLFLHYFDPHFPYAPPEPFASTFSTDPYVGEIAYTDQAVGEVMATLKELGLYDSSLIVIVGDHGESLGDHGERQHGYFIYHSTTKVPLIIKPPGRSASRFVDTPVSLIDVMPTVLGLLELPVPMEVQGDDLSMSLSNDRTGDAPKYVYSESMWPTKYHCNSLLGIENSEWKYIQTTRPELYDLRNDPGEQLNVLAQHTQVAQFFQAQLASMLETHVRMAGTDSRRAPDAEDIERLRALGYTGGPLRDSYEFETESEDPKDFIDAHRAIERIDELKGQGRFLEARVLGLELLARRPDLVVLHSRLGSICVRLGDERAALAHYTKALALAPEHPDAGIWHHNIGRLFKRMNRLDEAAQHLNESLRRIEQAATSAHDKEATSEVNRGAQNLAVSVRLHLGDVLIRQSRAEDAVPILREAVERGPDNAPAHYLLGRALSSMGRDEDAAVEYQEAARLRQGNARDRSGAKAMTDEDGAGDLP